MLTDRGPNGETKVGGQERRTFPVPEFTPTIARVRVDGGIISILDTMPILGPSGNPVTGLSNVEQYDEEPFDYMARVRLPYRPTGLDTEGLVRTRPATSGSLMSMGRRSCTSMPVASCKSGSCPRM